jgi:hypothetical protein
MGGMFRRAACRVTRRARRVPAPIEAAALYLADTLDWLNLWQGDLGDELAHEHQDNDPNHLSPHL